MSRLENCPPAPAPAAPAPAAPAAPLLSEARYLYWRLADILGRDAFFAAEAEGAVSYEVLLEKKLPKLPCGNWFYLAIDATEADFWLMRLPGLLPVLVPVATFVQGTEPWQQRRPRVPPGHADFRGDPAEWAADPYGLSAECACAECGDSAADAACEGGCGCADGAEAWPALGAAEAPPAEEEQPLPVDYDIVVFAKPVRVPPRTFAPLGHPDICEPCAEMRNVKLGEDGRVVAIVCTSCRALLSRRHYRHCPEKGARCLTYRPVDAMGRVFNTCAACDADRKAREKAQLRELGRRGAAAKAAMAAKKQAVGPQKEAKPLPVGK